jgi:hypothetical protein
VSRFRALWANSPAKLLSGLVALTVASGLAIASGANFNSASANPTNVFSAGTLSQSNSAANQAILSAALLPGGSTTGTVDIANTGNAGAAFVLTRTAIVNTPASPPFSAKLTVQVQDLGDPACVSACPAATTLYSGALGAMTANIALGTFAPGVRHRYRFTVAFPNAADDNDYLGAATSVDFSWIAST